MADPAVAPDAFAELQATAGEDFVRELVDTFLEEAPPMLDGLRAALASGDAEAFRRAAHSLKSNSDTFGAYPLGMLARDLELKGLAYGAQSNGHALDALVQEYARVRAALIGLRDA